jgi:hypothetical protein
MAKKMTIDGKKYNIDWLAELVKEGHQNLETMSDELRRAVERKLGQWRAESNSRTLTGRVVRETEKAILFREAEGGETWWPKSQARLLERAMGPLDQLVVPEWLHAKKQIA